MNQRRRTVRPTPGIVIASIALLAALTGTSFAASQALVPRNSVGSPQVINNSLLLKDFKKSQRAKLRGPRGAQGPEGPQGAAGPAGPAGIARVTSALGPAAGQCGAGGGGCQIAQSVAVCPSGYTVVGGGHVSGSITNIVLYSARNSPTTYTVIAENEDTAANTIAAQAICAAGPGLVGASAGSKPASVAALRAALER